MSFAYRHLYICARTLLESSQLLVLQVPMLRCPVAGPVTIFAGRGLHDLPSFFFILTPMVVQRIRGIVLVWGSCVLGILLHATRR